MTPEEDALLGAVLEYLHPQMAEAISNVGSFGIESPRDPFLRALADENGGVDAAELARTVFSDDPRPARKISVELAAALVEQMRAEASL